MSAYLYSKARSKAEDLKKKVATEAVKQKLQAASRKASPRSDKLVETSRLNKSKEIFGLLDYRGQGYITRQSIEFAMERVGGVARVLQPLAGIFEQPGKQVGEVEFLRYFTEYLKMLSLPDREALLALSAIKSLKNYPIASSGARHVTAIEGPTDREKQCPSNNESETIRGHRKIKVNSRENKIVEKLSGKTEVVDIHDVFESKIKRYGRNEV